MYKQDEEVVFVQIKCTKYYYVPPCKHPPSDVITPVYQIL
jgi:hypothetical protein